MAIFVFDVKKEIVKRIEKPTLAKIRYLWWGSNIKPGLYIQGSMKELKKVNEIKDIER